MNPEQTILEALGLTRWPQSWRGLPRVPDADRVTPVGRSPYGRVVFLAPPAAAAWQRLRLSAEKAGVELLPISGFRSFQRQLDLVHSKLLRAQTLNSILEVNTLPGFSEHHSGCALDLGAAGAEPHLSEAFECTLTYEWLSAHAANHGFQLSYPRNNAAGILFEPWHWCWRAHDEA